MDVTRVGTPAATVFQIWRPFTVSSAAKYTAPLKSTASRGPLPSSPGAISPTILVPAAEPSVTHNSVPVSSDDASK